MNNTNLELDIQEHCRFCTPPDSERILYSDEDFYIMLSLGPIVEGYLLLITKNHFTCCAALPVELQGRFIQLASKIENILIEVYGSCCFYEHGQAGSCLDFNDSSKHCFHAHLHCIPIKKSINNAIIEPFPNLELDSWDSFFRTYNKFQEPYFFVKDQKSKFYIANKIPPRQFLRKKAASVVGNNEAWDWVKYQSWDKIFLGREKLFERFKNI
jgi:diadenosine tetraphosphate (Ap4A) HIT family hydrolase